MKYGEAFIKLGYQLDVPRLHWSAESDKGVCVAIWSSEIDWKSLTLNSNLHCGPIDEWPTAGKRKREGHFRHAIENFDGWLDAVIVKGVPGKGADSADPWFVSERQNFKWKLTNFDDASGHFEMKAVPLE